MFEGLSTTSIILLIALHVLLVGGVACLMIWRAKKYYVAEEISGDIIWVLKQSSERNIRNCAMYIVVGCFFSSRLFRLTDIDIFRMITSCVLAIEMIAMAVFSTLPYKICAKGIITHQGFVEWSMIRKIMDSEKGEGVVLKLKRQVDNELVIYCQKEEREKFERYVRERIDLE